MASKGKETPSICVIGSVNLDLVAHTTRLPKPGETVSGATLARYPGGKGANQALAAKRLGATVSLCACVGDDAEADLALDLLRKAHVDLTHCQRLPGVATGVALIAVDSQGENQIVVAPGANHCFLPPRLQLPHKADALLCQLEVPDETLLQAIEGFEGLVCVNLAPARSLAKDIIARADVLIANEGEAQAFASELKVFEGLLAVTYGAKGAALFRKGQEIARAPAPKISVCDTTGAGDAFCAGLVFALIRGDSADHALRFACHVGAAAATKPGAQPAMPSLDAVMALMALQAE